MITIGNIDHREIDKKRLSVFLSPCLPGLSGPKTRYLELYTRKLLGGQGIRHGTLDNPVPLCLVGNWGDLPALPG